MSTRRKNTHISHHSIEVMIPKAGNETVLFERVKNVVMKSGADRVRLYMYDDQGKEHIVREEDDTR